MPACVQTESCVSIHPAVRHWVAPTLWPPRTVLLSQAFGNPSTLDGRARSPLGAALGRRTGLSAPRLFPGPLPGAPSDPPAAQRTRRFVPRLTPRPSSSLFLGPFPRGGVSAGRPRPPPFLGTLPCSPGMPGRAGKGAGWVLSVGKALLCAPGDRWRAVGTVGFEGLEWLPRHRPWCCCCPSLRGLESVRTVHTPLSPNPRPSRHRQPVTRWNEFHNTSLSDGTSGQV